MSMQRSNSPARVVVVEDSLVQRANLVGVLEADLDIVVVGEAATAVEAIAMVAALRPDVVTLDLNIPGGGGQFALEQIMARTPTPILVLSSTVHDRTSVPALDALVGGALMAVPKPTRWTPQFEADLRRDVRTIRTVPVVRHIRGSHRLRAATAVGAALSPAARVAASPSSSSSSPPSRSAGSSPPSTRTGGTVIAIAASTGGPAALATVLDGLARVTVPVLIVQHIHPDFVQGLADWMARVSPLPVVLAEHGQPLRGGCIHIGPGDKHLRIGRDWRIELADAPLTVHRPSADELFDSVASRAGTNGIGVVLTGMGDDGAAGLAAMRRAGGRTIAQDEATSAVYGMPRAAVLRGAIEQQLPLASIAEAVVRLARAAARSTS